MARPLRVEFSGAVYHVMARGNCREDIYQDDQDRQRFLETLAEACQKTGWRIHAYVLMSNHYHLLVETPEPNLVAGMKWLQGAYTQRYHRRHGLCGHLFQGRYQAVVIDSQKPSYFQIVSTYIHLNPVRAGLVRPGEEALRSYRWSSYPWFLAKAGQAPEWLQVERVLGSLGLGEKQAKGYEAYLESRVLELGSKAGRKELDRQWEQLRRGWYLGGKEFRDQVMVEIGKAVQNRRRESQGGPAKKAHDEAAAEGMLAEGLKILGWRRERLHQTPKGSLEKLALARWLRQQTTVSNRWISEKLRMGHYSRVTAAKREMKDGPNRKLKALARKLRGLETQSVKD